MRDPHSCYSPVCNSSGSAVPELSTAAHQSQFTASENSSIDAFTFLDPHLHSHACLPPGVNAWCRALTQHMVNSHIQIFKNIFHFNYFYLFSCGVGELWGLEDKVQKWVSLFNVGVLGVELRSSCLVAKAFIPEPSCCPCTSKSLLTTVF